MNHSAWRVRPLQAGDVVAVLSIQQASPEAARWSASDYERAIAPPSYATVAEEQGSIVGFLVARVISDELEILNLAVQPEARHRGIASLLLADALEFARAAGARHAFLEVRESNRAAVAFYERHGFALRGRRRNYYPDPVEDALILAHALS